ncbi:MAG TPA: hypothetical protein VMR95_01795, partial [Candidatus Binatia bacterium]|nr:hypothetical protein [Candidatus Binatia bacterium]
RATYAINKASVESYVSDRYLQVKPGGPNTNRVDTTQAQPVKQPQPQPAAPASKPADKPPSSVIGHQVISESIDLSALTRPKRKRSRKRKRSPGEPVSVSPAVPAAPVAQAQPPRELEHVIKLR